MIAPEAALLGKLAEALEAILAGADSAARIMGPLPRDAGAFAALDDVQSTGARALLKAVEQAQDVLARLFRTFLLAEQIDTSGLTARDIANRMEKYGLLADADAWSALVRLRNRLAHEYPLSASAQLERVGDALAAIPRLRAIRDDVRSVLQARGYIR